MGRGRAKAKQTKVARQLKYQPAGDLDRLRSELGVNDPPSRPSGSNGSRDHEPDDRYAAYADYDEDAEEEDEDDDEDDEGDSYSHR
jgi:hypothetical protein